jgi:hypothetical protein
MHRPSHHAGHPHAHRLARWQRLALFVTGTLLLLTGCVWLAVHYSIGAGAGELPHPMEGWSMRLHGLGAFGGLFVLGTLSAAHVPQGWRLSRRRGWAVQRKSGVTLCVLGGLLVLSGYLLYYFASETLRPALGWAHTFAGIAMGLLISTHRRGV